VETHPPPPSFPLELFAGLCELLIPFLFIYKQGLCELSISSTSSTNKKKQVELVEPVERGGGETCKTTDKIDFSELDKEYRDCANF
jgi:hypothetical protein